MHSRAPDGRRPISAAPPTHKRTQASVNVARRLPTARFGRLITAWRRRHLDMADPSAGGAPSHLGPLCSLQRALHCRKTEPRPGERERERRRRCCSIVTVLHRLQWDSSVGLWRRPHLLCATRAKLVRDDCGNLDTLISIKSSSSLLLSPEPPCEAP